MERLYDNDAYLQEFQAEVISCTKNDKGYVVELDRTAFYPEGGGQPSDTGKIGNSNVIYVYEDVDKVLHLTDNEVSLGAAECFLDWNRRYDHMQQHTGQHLLSAVIYDKLKGETSGFHLGEDYVSIDINVPEIKQDEADEIEKQVNNLIEKNLTTRTHVTNSKGAADFPLRKLPPDAEKIRIVEIDKMDYSPCCGTHVSSLSQIGIVKIMKLEKYKGMTKIYFKCGRRALEDYKNKCIIINNLTKFCSVPEGEILPKVLKDSEEIKSLSKKLIEVKEKLAYLEVKEIIASESSGIILKDLSDKEFDELQIMAKAFSESTDDVFLLYSEKAQRLIAGHSGKASFDTGKFFKENLKNFSGKGGGSLKQAQAGFSSSKDMLAFIDTFKKNF